MMETQLLKKDLTKVGEEISHDLANQMVMDYQSANPTDTKGFYIGRQIIEEILAQPGCVGIQFHKAYNEVGEKTLVYVGVDSYNKPLVEFSLVNLDGTFDTKKGIVADRTGWSIWDYITAIR